MSEAKRVAAERDADEHAEDGAGEEADQGLFHRHPEVIPERRLVGAFRCPAHRAAPRSRLGYE